MKMGQQISSLFTHREQINILMVGTYLVGKTVILYQLKRGEVVFTIPTIGMNMETIQYKNFDFTFFEIPGNAEKIWPYHYENKNGLVYVVDSTNKDDMPNAREQLHTLLKADELRDAVVMIFANKQDLPQAMRPIEIADILGLNLITERRWHIQATSAITGQGLYEGLAWLSNELAKKNNDSLTSNSSDNSKSVLK